MVADSGWKNGHIFLKNVLLKLNFQHDGQLNSNCLIYILTFYREFLGFQFFTRAIRTHVPILTVVQNACISRRKNSHILQKNVGFVAKFWDEGYLYTNYLFYILTIYCKWFIFQFFSRGILTHIIRVIIAFLVTINMVIFC